jgi:outer membrane autotransporter protein
MRQRHMSVKAFVRPNFGHSLLRTTALWRAAVCAGPLIAVFATAGGAQAQEYVWGGSGSSTTSSDYNLATNWGTGSPDNPPPDSSLESAAFYDLGNAAITVTTPVTVNGLYFGSNAQSYTLDGGAITLDGTVATISNNSSGVGVTQTINNVIAGTLAPGTPQVIQNGNVDNTLVLGGVNTYTGDTSLQGGSVKLVGSGSIANSFVSMASVFSVLDVSGVTTGSTSIGGLSSGFDSSPGGNPQFVNVKLGANTLNIGGVGNAGGGNAIGGVIDGTGGVNFTAGYTQIYNAQAYTGATTITGGAGVIVFGSQFFTDTYGVTASLAKSSLVTVDAGSDLQFYHFAGLSLGSTTFSLMSLAGAGNVFQDANTLVLTDASSTFSGVIGFDNVYLSGAAATGGLEIAGGKEILTGTNIYAGLTKIDAGATLQLGAGGGSGSVAGDILDNGTLALDRSDAFTFANVITGNGALQHNGSGTTTFTSNSAAFTGATTVSAGKLIVDGSLAGSIVTVDANGTLGGSGTVGGVVLDGTIAPGGSPGTLNVAGNIAVHSGSTYQVQVEASGAGDKIAAGTATISGGTVAVDASAGTYAPTTVYTILSATAVNGTFSDLTENLAFLDASLTYDPQNVYLRLTRNDITVSDIAQTPNQHAVGAVITATDTPADIYNGILSLTADGARDALDQLSGEIHASAKGMLVDDSHFVRDAVDTRLRAAFGDGSTASLPVMAYGEDGAVPAAANTSGFAVWSQGFGFWGGRDGDGNAAKFDRSLGGLLIGADGMVGDWRVGLVGGYSHSSFDVDGGHSSGDSDNYHLGIYGGTDWGALALRTGAAYTWHRLSTVRSVAFGGFADQLSADYDAGTAQVFGELAYKTDAGGFTFEPFDNLAYVNLRADGFSETGGSAALTSASSNTDLTYNTLGLRASTKVMLGRMQATARGMLGWRHAFGDVTPTSTLAFAGGDAFEIAGVPLARDAAVIEAGLDVQLAASATLGLSYAGQFGGGTHDNGFKLDLGVRF